MELRKLLLVLMFVMINCRLVFTRKSSVDTLREYLRLDTSNPENIKYAVDFWRQLASMNGLPFVEYQPSGEPICVITLFGSNRDLPSIMLNSHMDVVKANESEWSYPPFAATIVGGHTIIGRGAQDTKALAIQQFESLLYFKENNITFPRTIHMTLMPDEETGGKRGMESFVKTDEFKNLNVGFVLDEGLTINEDNFYVTNVDKRPWQMDITIEGEGGHGAQMPNSVAVLKLSRLLNTVLAFRDEQIQIQKVSQPYGYGAYTSVNVNIINGGTQVNVIPLNMQVSIDMRLCEHCTAEVYNKMVESWLRDANITTPVKFIRREEISYTTAADQSNPFWTAMVDAVRNELGKNITPLVCPATSDSIYLRENGYRAIGFSPNLNMKSRIHNKDEYITISAFLKGVEYYRQIVKKLASVV